MNEAFMEKIFKQVDFFNATKKYKFLLNFFETKCQNRIIKIIKLIYFIDCQLLYYFFGIIFFLNKANSKIFSLKG